MQSTSKQTDNPAHVDIKGELYMVYYSIKCPHCNNVVESGHDRKTQYGSPFRECKFCGSIYVDTNFIEAGLYEEREIFKKSFKWIIGAVLLFCVGVFFLYVGISSLSVVSILIGVASLALCIFCIVSNLKYDPEQDEELQREFRESKRRLSDPHYVIALWKAECHLTTELLAWAKKEVAKEEIAQR